VGLIAGLFVAFLVYLQMRPEQMPTHPSVTLDKTAPTDKHKPDQISERAMPALTKPRFDFYNLLPEMEVIVPEQQISGTPTREGVKQVEQPGTYLLQAGSFRSKQQADQLRAKLALLGLETSLQTVSINSKQAWHRVRVGPFSNLRDLNEARRLLQNNGVDAILIRLKG
jgi:cell division protein FtsN